MNGSKILFAFFLAAGLSIGTATAAKPVPKPFNINDLHIDRLISSIQCLPHEPEATSSSSVKTAIADGDAALVGGHCQAAIADYQRVIDTDPSNVTALWKQEIAALRQFQLSQDEKISHDAGEMSYHDADLAVMANPKDAVFLLLRASSRIALIRIHVMRRSPITMTHYMASENQHSYDDLTQAIALQPTYGEAYADRWVIDVHRQDMEQAQFDIAQAQKFDPESARTVQQMQQYAEQRSAQIRADQLRSQIATANAMMGLAAAASGGELIVVPQNP